MQACPLRIGINYAGDDCHYRAALCFPLALTNASTLQNKTRWQSLQTSHRVSGLVQRWHSAGGEAVRWSKRLGITVWSSTANSNFLWGLDGLAPRRLPSRVVGLDELRAFIQCWYLAICFYCVPAPTVRIRAAANRESKGVLRQTFSRPAQAQRNPSARSVGRARFAAPHRVSPSFN